jgi:hypothetical protein
LQVLVHFTADPLSILLTSLHADKYTNNINNVIDNNRFNGNVHLLLLFSIDTWSHVIIF